MRKPTLKSLKKKLWLITSQLIKKIYGNKCYTCGRKAEGAGLHCGHFIPSSTCGIGLRYDLRNLRPQCYYCNINLGGNGAVYAKKFIDKYGQEEFNEILRLQSQGYMKYTIDDYKRLIKEYEIKILELPDAHRT